MPAGLTADACVTCGWPYREHHPMRYSCPDYSTSDGVEGWAATHYEAPPATVLPPRGYCIGVFGTGQVDGMIGPFATEEDARAALADAVICTVGHHQ